MRNDVLPACTCLQELEQRAWLFADVLVKHATMDRDELPEGVMV